MEVILRQDVPRLGAKGQTLRVADGYARNFLLPRGLALPATEAALRRVRAEQQALHARLANERAYVETLKERLGKQSVTIAVASGPDDRLFGAVTNTHIAEALQREGLDIDKRKIALPEPITALGAYHVPVHLQADITAMVNVWVVKQ